MMQHQTLLYHIRFEYEHLGSKIPSSTPLGVMNCYLDLTPRTKGKLKDSYGQSLVNMYVPTVTFAALHVKMTELSEVTSFAEGGEIVDHKQGLTSFLCQKVVKDRPLLQVVMSESILRTYKEH